MQNPRQAKNYTIHNVFFYFYYYVIMWSPNLVTWTGHLTRHTTLSKQFHKIINLALCKVPPPLDMRLTLDIQPILDNKTYIRCHFVSISDSEKSLTFSIAETLGLSVRKAISFILVRMLQKHYHWMIVLWESIALLSLVEPYPVGNGEMKAAGYNKAWL